MSIEFLEPRSRCASAAADAKRQSSRGTKEPMTQTTFAVEPVICYHMAAAIAVSWPERRCECSPPAQGRMAARMLAYWADTMRTTGHQSFFKYMQCRAEEEEDGKHQGVASQ